MTSSNPSCRPFVKWAGGKKQLLPELALLYPQMRDKKIRRYCEPFVGGGAVLFDILQRYTLDEVYINDINAELINAYICIRDSVDELIDSLAILQRDYQTATEDAQAVLFHSKRKLFNERRLMVQHQKSIELAALFIFLNRTCFNGLYRTNSKGDFNVPMGRYKNPIVCDEKNLRCVSKHLQNVTITCGKYDSIPCHFDNQTFVYLDPPYRPLSTTASFTSYTPSGFNDNDQIELANFVKMISESQAFFLLSNSDPKNISEDDTFFDDLYSRFTIKRIMAKRMINAKASHRGLINELAIYNQ